MSSDNIFYPSLPKIATSLHHLHSTVTGRSGAVIRSKVQIRMRYPGLIFMILDENTQFTIFNSWSLRALVICALLLA